MPATKSDPLLTTRFLLKIDGMPEEVTFTKVSGIGVTTTPATTMEVKASGSRHQVKVPTVQQSTELQLSRQVDDQLFFWDWMKEIIAGKNTRKNGSITVYTANDMGEKVVINIRTFFDGHRPPDRVLPGRV